MLCGRTPDNERVKRERERERERDSFLITNTTAGILATHLA